jgi:hypothetical protein
MALKKIGGLWLNEKDGKKYMSGQANEAIPAGAKILVFKNTYKEAGDKKPDYTINVAVDDQPAPEEPSQEIPSDQPF